MAKLVFGMNQSLDGYVDHDKFSPDDVLFRYFIEQAKTQTGSIYGRRLYEVMRYFDVDDPDWTPEVREFGDAWRRQPKWVVSRTLTEVGPNATLIRGDVEAAVGSQKAELDGEIEVGGPELAHSLAGLIDQYRIYLHPVVLGQGKPFFFAARPPLRLAATERIGEQAILLTYEPI
jgi:dihydrofolate reductase